MKALVLQEVGTMPVFGALAAAVWCTVVLCETDRPWQGHRVALVSDHPVPAIGNTDVLVKVVSVAQNPTDWKRTYRKHTTPLSSIQHPASSIQHPGSRVQPGPAGCSPQSTYLLSTLIL